MRRIAIIGGGFGLYGHCQSILDRRWGTVVLERRFRDRLLARNELSGYVNDIEWVDVIADAFPILTGCILALPPAEQTAAVMACLKSPHRFALGLEKPLSANPESAMDLLAHLRNSGRNFCVNYSFIYAQWYKALARCVDEPLFPLQVRWTFRAHHHRVAGSHWKGRHSLGGGALRFYGIHLIAVAARLGYEQVVSAQMGGPMPDTCEYWHAMLAGPGLPDLVLQVDDHAEINRFEVSTLSGPSGHESRIILQRSDPFGWEAPVHNRDIRCAMLDQFHDDLDIARTPTDIEWYSRVLDLWGAIERNAVWDTRR